MAGDITQPKRPRYESNERFDTVDANAASVASRDQDDAKTRGVLITPRATAMVPVGIIVSGFSLTLNPTSGTDSLVRVNAEAGVALDSNGRTIIKPSGTTQDVTIPTGTFQIYAYYVETATDAAKRRFLPVVSPFVEYTKAIDTAFQGALGLYVRAGTLGTVVAEDVVNGATTPLCLLGIATNPGTGVIGLTGRPDDTTLATAPNGTDITNRLSVVTAIAGPATNIQNGSLKTLHDVITAALYTIGQTAWKGSDSLVPMASNNFGAYSIPAGGADKAFRQALGYVTIGNGTTIVGDFNTADYANAKLLLDAALASLPATGGTILLKRGVALAGFAGATVTMPAGKTVEIVGDHSSVPATPQITFVASEGLVCSVTGQLTLRNLYIQHVDTAVTVTNTTGGFRAVNVYFDKPSSADTGAALQGVDVANVTLEDVTFKTLVTATGTTNAMALRITGIGQRLDLRRVRHSVVGDDCASLSVADLRDNFTIDGYEISDDGGIFSGAVFGYAILLATTVNTGMLNRHIRNVRVSGPFWTALSTGNVAGIVVERLNTLNLLSESTYTGTAPSTGTVTFRECEYTSNVTDGGFVTHKSIAGDVGVVVFDRVTFTRTGNSTNVSPINVISAPNGVVNRVSIVGCSFSGFKRGDNLLVLINISASGPTGTVRDVLVDRCRFEDFQNVAYTGGAGTSALVYVSCTRSESIVVRGCNAYNLLGGTSGNDRDQAYLLKTSGVGSDGYFEFVRVINNDVGGVVGATTDMCGLWSHDDQAVTFADISRNRVRIAWNTDATRGKWVDGSVLRVTSSTTNRGQIKGIRFDGNDIEINNESNTDYTKNLYFLDNTGAAQVLNNSIQDNQLYSNSTSKKFDYSTAWGIYIPSYTHTNLAFAGNNASSGNPIGLADAWRISMTGATTNAFNPINTGVGGVILGNNGIFSNAA